MRFFISSTYSDLKNIRQVAINTIESLTNGVTGQVAAMEYFVASPEDSKSVCIGCGHRNLCEPFWLDE